MTRILTDHILNEAQDLIVEVADEPGPGGANHVYVIKCPDGRVMSTINFQEGAIQEVGVNGLTNEVLLAIVIDRLRGFDKGPFATIQNALALHGCLQAMGHLHARTIERRNRGVEGRSVA